MVLRALQARFGWGLNPGGGVPLVAGLAPGYWLSAFQAVPSFGGEDACSVTDPRLRGSISRAVDRSSSAGGASICHSGKAGERPGTAGRPPCPTSLGGEDNSIMPTQAWACHPTVGVCHPI